MEQVETVPPATSMVYDVFISHRGPDAKKTLASLIYYRLRNRGLSVFLDQNEMDRGEVIQHAICKAIQTARIHVAIFSQSYAESTWCLEELNLMWESKKEGRSSIITVFCDVGPRDLRRIEKGSYAQFFEEHKSKGRVSEEVLKKWKDALKNVSFISGIKFRANKSDYGGFLEEVAKRVFNLEQKLEPVEVAKDQVWLAQAAEDIQSRIRQAEKDFQIKTNNSKVKVIVQIVGMVGVGKSTLAKYLYQKKRSDFTASCFVNDVSKQEILPLLQNLHHGLFGNYDLKRIPYASEAERILRKRIGNLSSVFLVLDNVHGAAEKEKIESLLDMEGMASGSLVLITSREKLPLEEAFVELKLDNVKTLVYEVKLMEEEHARELFCRHAFDQPTPPERFEDLTVQSLQICGGLPSSLEILGRYFHNEREKEDWERQLEGFSETPPKDIIDRLKGSYEALDPEEKKVFLDIGCFLVGEEQKLAIQVLKGLYANINIEENLKRLRRKCLMIGDNHSGPSLDMISMPDPFSRLARDIARKEFSTPDRPQRFSCSNDIKTMLEIASEFGTWGIRFSKTPAFREGIIRAKGVRLFVAEGGVDLSSFFHSWDISGELVWLRLPIQSLFRFPKSISLQTLRVLELEGQEKNVLHFLRNCLYDEDRRDLNTLDAGASTSISRPAHTSSIFRFWQSGVSIFRTWLQPSIPQFLERRVPGMGALTALELKNIISLQSLPIDFSRLPNLTQLDLSGCLNLTELPSLSNLLKLEFLNINECSNLETLNVEGLTSLKEIKALGCRKLKKIGDLNRRERLNCLYISTDNPLIWDDICEFLRSSSHEKPSAAIFSGRRENDERVINPEMIHKIARAENLRKPEITIGDIHSYGAIMVLFITDDAHNEARSPEFSVTIKQSHNGSSGSALEYRTARANRGGRRVNVLIFHVFKEGKSGIDVCCSHLDSILEGRVVMVDKDADVPKVCEEIMRVYL